MSKRLQYTALADALSQMLLRIRRLFDAAYYISYQIIEFPLFTRASGFSQVLEETICSNHLEYLVRFVGRGRTLACFRAFSPGHFFLPVEVVGKVHGMVFTF